MKLKNGGRNQITFCHLFNFALGANCANSYQPDNAVSIPEMV